MKYSAEDFYQEWQRCWGNLEESWQPLFVAHPSLSFILRFDSRLIQIALSKHKKLESIATYLDATSYPEPKNKQQVKANSFDPPGSMQQAVNVSYKNSKLDPKLPDSDWWREQE
jgi:hypothetical protein